MEVTIERLGHKGDGIAPGPVFVPRALPGEVVEGDVIEGRMAAPRIVVPSSDRVKAPCRHYKSCGGCDLQHANDAFVAQWKRDIVEAALVARGLKVAVRKCHTSPASARRRAVFSGRRTKSGAIVGFHSAGSDVVREIPECTLLTPKLLQSLPALGEIVRAGASRKGGLRLTVSDTESGLDVLATGGHSLDISLTQTLLEHMRAGDFARLTWDDETVATLRQPTLTFGSATVSPPPGAFLQATREGEAALLGSVLDALGDGSDPVVDLFAGIGTFSLPLAQTRSVHAVEGERDMTEALYDGWRGGANLHALSVETRDLFRRPLLADELEKYGAAVIDPPRAGAEAQTAELAKSGIKRIACVSCNPVTFARDAGLLTDAGYQLAWIDVIDQFRWSPHIELVAQFSLD